MPDWIAIILLGIIEGITEFIPISSTGHLLLVQNSGWLPRQSDLFNIVIQSGAVLAVIPLFPERWKQFINNWREPATISLLGKIAVAFLITGIGGLVLEKLNFTLEENVRPIAIALLVGGALFIAIERWLKGKSLSTEITWTVAIAVALAQLLAAVFPGTSRSGSTILIALLLGISRPAATEFSFLVGIPTMLAAGAWKILKELRGASNISEDWGLLALGTLVSAIVSFIAVKWLLRYVQTHTFTAFGWYRIVLGTLILLLLA